jgi:hypothetical protein
MTSSSSRHHANEHTWTRKQRCHSTNFVRFVNTWRN